MEKLKARQEDILKRIESLNKRIITTIVDAEEEEEEEPKFEIEEHWQDTESIKRVKSECKKLNLTSARFKRVASTYYDWSLEQRRDCLGADNIDQLCKTIILENGRCVNKNCDDPLNSRYYAVIIQYTTKLQSQKVFHFVRGLKNYSLGKKKYKFRLAPPEDAVKLTGFEFNGTSPIGMLTKVPIIVSEAILKASNPPFMWFGAGDKDLKIGVDVNQFIKATHSYVTDVLHDGGPDTTEQDEDD